MIYDLTELSIPDDFTLTFTQLNFLLDFSSVLGELSVDYLNSLLPS